MRQLNVSFDDRTFVDLRHLADNRGTAITDLVRLSVRTLLPPTEIVEVTLEGYVLEGEADIVRHTISGEEFWNAVVRLPHDQLTKLKSAPPIKPEAHISLSLPNGSQAMGLIGGIRFSVPEATLCVSGITSWSKPKLPA